MSGCLAQQLCERAGAQLGDLLSRVTAAHGRALALDDIGGSMNLDSSRPPGESEEVSKKLRGCDLVAGRHDGVVEDDCRKGPPSVKQAAHEFTGAEPALLCFSDNPRTTTLAAGDGADDEKGLNASGDSFGQRSLGRFMGKVLPGSEEPDKRPALMGDVVADRPAQHRIAGLERVEDRALRYGPSHLELDLAVDTRQAPQNGWQHDSDHGSICTSIESTGGRSRTMGAQLFPASAEAYTCPPVVPK
jgi:hypothetical protein